MIGKGRLKTERIGFRQPLNQAGLELVIDFEHDVARFAIVVVRAFAADFVVLVVVTVEQVGRNQCKFQVFRCLIINVGIEYRITTALHAVEAGGFALCGYAAADGPFLPSNGRL